MQRTEIGQDEIVRRRDSLEAELERRGLAAAVIATPENFHYLTGYRSPSWALQARPTFLVIRPRQSAVAIVNAAEADRLDELTRGVEAHAYGEPIRSASETPALLDFAPAALAHLQAVLQPLGRSIGFELGSQMIARIAFSAIEDIRRELALETSDVNPLLWTLRLQKSEAERDALRASAAALTSAYALFERGAHPGMTEIELYSLFRDCAMQSGADSVGYLIVIAGTAGSVLGPPTMRRWEPRSLLLVDAGLLCDGYWSDFSRLYCAEEPSSEQRSAYAGLVEALERGRDRIVPGATAAAIAEALAEPHSSSNDSFGRVGHGVGLDLTEPPSLHRLDDSPLRPGMTLCLEPNWHAAGVGLVVGEETVEVTSTGSKLLSSRFPSELPVIAR